MPIITMIKGLVGKSIQNEKAKPRKQLKNATNIDIKNLRLFNRIVDIGGKINVANTRQIPIIFTEIVIVIANKK